MHRFTRLVPALLALGLWSCSPGSLSATSKASTVSCYSTAHGTMCTHGATLAPGADADGDGVADQLVCGDGDDGDSGGDDSADSADTDTGDSHQDHNGNGNSDDSDRAGMRGHDDGEEDGNDDGDSHEDGNGDGDSDSEGADDTPGHDENGPCTGDPAADDDGDGIPNGMDCDCGGVGVPTPPPTTPPPGTPPPTTPPPVTPPG